MHLQSNETRAALCVLRFILLGALSALIVGTALVLALFVSIAQASQRKHRGLTRPALIVTSALAIAYLLWHKRDSKWHACGQCGVPIVPPSRAEYCSPTCRRYARLRREELERRSELLASFGEVPF
jgi:aromatic ring hydroxylase